MTLSPLLGELLVAEHRPVPPRMVKKSIRANSQIKTTALTDAAANPTPSSVCILMGCGIPTTARYITMVTVALSMHGHRPAM